MQRWEQKWNVPSILPVRRPQGIEGLGAILEFASQTRYSNVASATVERAARFTFAPPNNRGKSLSSDRCSGP